MVVLLDSCIAFKWRAAMLSRARTLEGLLILRPATFEELNRGAPQYLLDEVDRLLSLEKESTQDLRRYIEKLPCQVPSEILDLFRDDAESEEIRRVVAVQTQAAVSTGSDIRPRRRLRGKQVGPSAAVSQAAYDSEVKPSVPVSSTPSHADKRHLLATMAEDRAAKAMKRGIGCVNLVERKRKRSELNSAIDVVNTPAGARARRYANTVKNRLLDAGANERLKSGKFVLTFLKANAVRRRADAVRGSDVSIPSASSGISVAMTAVPPSSYGSQLPESLADSTTFVCLLEHEDSKPRGLVNMLRIGYGSGSCWISAGLQFLFGSERLQGCLRDHFNTNRERFCRRNSVASQSPWMLARDDSLLTDTSRRLSRRTDADSQINLFDGLSLTYLAMLQGRDSTGFSLVGRDYVPHIQVATFRLYCSFLLLAFPRWEVCCLFLLGSFCFLIVTRNTNGTQH